MKAVLLAGMFTETSVYADGWFDNEYGDFISKHGNKALYLGGQLEDPMPLTPELLDEIESQLRAQYEKRNDIHN